MNDTLLKIWCDECERANAWVVFDNKGLSLDQAALVRIGSAIEDAAAAAFQARVAPWMLACFGAEISRDRTERSHRFLEEALELVQVAGCTASEAHQLVDYVFGRPVGELSQEVGGVLVTLAALKETFDQWFSRRVVDDSDPPCQSSAMEGWNAALAAAPPIAAVVGEPVAWMTPDGMSVMTPEEKDEMSKAGDPEDYGFAERHDVALVRASARTPSPATDPAAVVGVEASESACIMHLREAWATLTNLSADMEPSPLRQQMQKRASALREFLDGMERPDGTYTLNPSQALPVAAGEAVGPGTPAYRFRALMDELEKRFPDPHPYSASLPEPRILALLDAAIAGSPPTAREPLTPTETNDLWRRWTDKHSQHDWRSLVLLVESEHGIVAAPTGGAA